MVEQVLQAAQASRGWLDRQVLRVRLVRQVRLASVVVLAPLEEQVPLGWLDCKVASVHLAPLASLAAAVT